MVCMCSSCFQDKINGRAFHSSCRNQPEWNKSWWGNKGSNPLAMVLSSQRWPWLIMFVSSTLQALYCTRRTCLQFFYISFAPMWIVFSFILLLQILAHVSPKPAIKPSEEEYADAAPANFGPPVFGNHICFLSEETFAPNYPEVLFSSLGCCIL